MGLYDSLPENSFIKKLLLGIDETLVERFLDTKRTYEMSKDKEEKRLFRDKLINLFWELYSKVAVMINPDLSMAKRLFLRYGIVDLRTLSPEDQQFILNHTEDPVNYEHETIFYIDEWLQGIVNGKIKPSSGDESEQPKTEAPRPISTRQEKHVGLLSVENRRFEEFKKSRSQTLHDLTHITGILKEELTEETTGYAGVWTPEQNKAVDEIIFLQKELKKLNKEILSSARTMRKAKDALDEIAREEEGSSTAVPVDLQREKILAEVVNIRQMAKMTVGRQGNPFPLLTSSFIPKETKDYLFRSTVRKKLNHWLSLDPEAFQRTYKGEEMNIMPYMILVPGYGITGACWEPLDPNNKQFGRGRIVLPIFTKSPDLSLLTAIADIRWQAAKEIASYYWMEEGLTGRYYEYYLEAKLKGDLRTLFMTDYLLWMTKETQGVQKLEQNARYVFWRYVPLPDEDKIRLSQKGYYYNQLWEKEQVWRKSKDR
ncbi:MAG: hypothetical protein ACRC0X_05985 [Brevinema sp.]